MSSAIQDRKTDQSESIPAPWDEVVDSRHTEHCHNTHTTTYQSEKLSPNDLIAEAFLRSYDLWAKSIYELSKCGAFHRLADITIPPLWQREQDISTIHQCRKILVDAWTYVLKFTPPTSDDFSYQLENGFAKLKIRSKSGLSDITFSKESFQAFCAALLRGAPLSHLEISAQFLKDHEAQIVSDLIDYSENLKEIYIMGVYEDEGAKTLARALTSSTSPYHTLWVQGRFSDDMEKHLSDVIQNRQHSHVLSHWISKR